MTDDERPEPGSGDMSGHGRQARRTGAPAPLSSAMRRAGPGCSGGRRCRSPRLFEFLEDGEELNDFLEWFPELPAEQVRAVLEHAGYSV